MSNKPLVLAARTPMLDNAPLVIISLLIFDSLHFVFARLLLPYLPPTTSGMYVLGIATVEVAIFIALWDRIHFDVFHRYLWFFLSIGFLVALSTAMTYASVAFIDPGTASLLGKASILFGLGFGVIWLRERLTRLESAGSLIAAGGLVMITFQPGDYLRLGALIVLISTFLYALHAALVKRYGGDMSLSDFFFFRVASTTGFLFLFAAGRGELMWPNAQAWLILLLTGTVDIVISRGLYYLALRRLRLSLHSIVLTLSPVVTIGWTLVLFGISPTLPQLIGGAGVMGGMLMLTIGKVDLRRKY